MKVIATELGFVLSFESIENMEEVISHLQGQLEWIKQENISPPYLYMTYDENINTEKVTKLLQELKK